MVRDDHVRIAQTSPKFVGLATKNNRNHNLTFKRKFGSETNQHRSVNKESAT